LAGPVIGSVTSTTAKIWIGYRGKGQNFLILGDTAEKRVYYPTGYSYISNKKEEVALTMDFTGLQPGHNYNILLSIDGWGSHSKYSFTTPSDSVYNDYNFLLGSCALMNTDVTRGVFPGFSTFIFKHMKNRGGDFMVWLGDEVYYLYPKHYKNYEGMFNRQMKIRKTYNHFYRDFLGNQPNYAIWDDHDAGPNNCDKGFCSMDSAMLVFKGFWPNAYPDQDKFKGNYFSFKKSDSEFFMTDDRTFRDHKGDSTGDFLGETQMVWLKNKLLMSDATFKFVCVGSQVLIDNGFDESYSEYPRERNDLLNFITTNNIKGVIFLTGDKHYSEISKRVWNNYPVYDFTCSPLTSPPLPRRLFGAYKNQWRVKHSDYPLKNFGKIWVSGEKGNRSLKFEIYGRGGIKKREYTINQNELMQNGVR
jgi:alkaline phosphatase D